MKYILLVFPLFLLPQARAEVPSARPKMQLIVKDIVALEKYFLDESSYLDTGAEKEVLPKLDDMREHVSAMEGVFGKDPALSVNVKLLKSHLDRTEQYFKEGNKRFSLYMLQSSLQMCVSCHTRGTSAQEFSLPENKAWDAKPPSDQIGFLLATRQFTKARDKGRAFVAGYPDNKIGVFELRKVLSALAVLYARVNPRPEEAAEYFGNLSARKDFPLYLQKDMKAWSADFSAWAKDKKPWPKTEAALVAAARKLLRADDLNTFGVDERTFHVRRLRASALLHKALESPSPSPAKGEALLLLGQIYHGLGNHLFFQLDELYLQACIQDNPKTKLAQQCYLSLEEYVHDGYTGSGGTNIPEAEEVELIRYKRMAYP